MRGGPRGSRARPCALVALGALAIAPAAAQGQWTHRYPMVAGGHQVYLEGYELPTLAVGPLDAAPSPDGRRVAVAARGWLWMLDPATGEATRLTTGGALDSRPAWSPDGRRLAFVRDDGSDTWIVLRDLATGAEEVAADGPGIDLDPAFGSDGALWYSSAGNGGINLWRLDPDGGEPTAVTEGRGLKLRAQPHPDGRRVVYLAKGGGPDRIVVRDLATGSERVLHDGAILSQLRPALSPDGALVAFNTPVAHGDGWELRLVSVEEGGPDVVLFGGEGDKPLAPAWSADGRHVWFSQPTRDEEMALFRVHAVGGAAEPVPVRAWRQGEATGRVRIRTMGTDAVPTAARLSVLGSDDHPLVPERTQPRFDGQTGTVFFYSPGLVEVEAPVGRVTVRAAKGLAAPVAAGTAQVVAGGIAEVELVVDPVWDARRDGWLSGDHHFHLNYGGPFRLTPEDIELQALGEDLDVPTPLIANLHDRYGDQEYLGWATAGSLPMVRFGQEIRSHFLGHMGALGVSGFFWPWVWGPGYEVYGADDRPNAEALAFVREQGGMPYYVHPVSSPDPFAAPGAPSLPVELVADAVLGDVPGLEVVCLWSDERGTAAAWHRFLDLGIPVAPTAGTDMMANFYRTMAVGTTRAYVHTDGATDFGSYLQGLKAGRSFVTNGPLLDFHVEDARPGGTIPADGRASFDLTLHTAVPVDTVQILVNGEVVWSGEAPHAPGSRAYRGEITLPSGGWIAARATGPATTVWPAMDSYAFAHTAPVWIGRVGSTEPEVERRAARELLGALDGALQRLRRGYGDADIPRLEARFEEARRELERRLGGG